MNSWTFEEYQKAHTLGVFSQYQSSLDDGMSGLSLDAGMKNPSYSLSTESETESNRRLLEAFYYAGGSMRFMKMFFSDKENVISVINTKINEVGDFSKLLSGLCGVSSEGFVNSLIGIYDNADSNTVLLSKYVIKVLSRKIDSTFIESAKNVLSSNPSWQGWVFELEFLTICKFKKRVQLFQLISVDLNETVESFLQLDIVDVKTYPKEMTGNLKSGTMIVPILWNQACYDGCFFTSSVGESGCSNYNYQFFNVTQSSKHSVFDLSHVAIFLNSLHPLTQGVATRKLKKNQTSANTDDSLEKNNNKDIVEDVEKMQHEYSSNATITVQFHVITSYENCKLHLDNKTQYSIVNEESICNFDVNFKPVINVLFYKKI
jgi:hypothetical protein